MDIIVIMAIAAILLVPFAFLLYQAFHRVKCPDCGDTLPTSYSWFKITRRMWRAGGYLCARCGCETNMAGQKVTADTPHATFLTLRWALLAVGLLVGVGVGVGAILMLSDAAAAVPASPMVAAPPLVAIPPQAPDVAPVN